MSTSSTPYNDLCRCLVVLEIGKDHCTETCENEHQDPLLVYLVGDDMCCTERAFPDLLSHDVIILLHKEGEGVGIELTQRKGRCHNCAQGRAGWASNVTCPMPTTDLLPKWPDGPYAQRMC